MKKIYTNSIILFDAISKGLFASLIVGLLIQIIGQNFNIKVLELAGLTAQYAMGSAIALSIAKAFNYKKITTYSSVVVGLIASGSIRESGVVGVGDALTSIFVSLIVLFILNKIERNNLFDILLIPLVGIILSSVLYICFKPISNEFLNFGAYISSASSISAISVPLTSLIFGFALTTPISSVALSLSIGITGKLAFAALVATSAQMSGFFVMSLRDNSFLNSLLVLFGTSMLLFKNIIKKPAIFIPPLLASAITGTLAYFTTDLVSVKEAAGMGLLGVTGQILTLDINGYTTLNIIIIIVYCLILPIILTFIFTQILVKIKVIKKGDLKL